MFMNILASAFALFAIYSLGAMSGLFAERSGTINLSINGGMLTGAIFYIVMSKYVSNDGDYQIWMFLISSIVGALSGMIITTLLSLGAINLRGDQVVIGTAINILAPVISLIMCYAVFNSDHVDGVYNYSLSSAVSSSGNLMDPWLLNLIVAIVILAIVGGFWYLVNKTKFGVRLRSAGENPHALAAAGVSVLWMRHFGMLISGLLAGLSGTLFASLTSSTFENNVSGMGYIALAILIVGQWRTQWIILAGLAMSFLFAWIDQYSVNFAEKAFLMKMIPYVSTIAILPLVSKWSKAPKAEGIPYVNAGR